MLEGLKEEIADMFANLWDRVPEVVRSPFEWMYEESSEIFDRAPGWSGTLALHAVLLVFLLGTPSCTPQEKPENMVIPIEMLPISEKNNIKPQDKKQAPKPDKKEKPKPTPPKPKEPEKAEPEPEEKPEPKPEKPKEKKPEPKPEPKKEPEKPKEKPKPEKPKEKPKKKKKAVNLDNLLENLEKDAPQQEQVEKEQKSDNYDASQPPSATELSNLARRIQDHWSIIAGAKGADQIIVPIRFRLTANGMLDGQPEVLEMNRYQSDPVYRAIADSGIRAIGEGAPYNFLAPDRIRAISPITVNFNPEGAI